jgi:hypothetical protein
MIGVNAVKYVPNDGAFTQSRTTTTTYHFDPVCRYLALLINHLPSSGSIDFPRKFGKHYSYLVQERKDACSSRGMLPS